MRVRSLPQKENVYNITVDIDHVYYANDILVKNCHDALQYAALGYESVESARQLEYSHSAAKSKRDSNGPRTKKSMKGFT